MPYACIEPQTLDHFCSDYKINPDTGNIRFEAPKTKGPPFPDYDEEESKTAKLLGRLCDRVYPHGKSESLGEFGQEFMGEPGQYENGGGGGGGGVGDDDYEHGSNDGDSDGENEANEYNHRGRATPRDPRQRRQAPTGRQNFDNRQYSGSYRQQTKYGDDFEQAPKIRQSDHKSVAMAKRTQREFKPSRYRESRFTTKRDTRKYPRSPYSKQRPFVYDSADRRDWSTNQDSDYDDASDYDDYVDEYYERRGRPIEHQRSRRDGYKRVQFKRRRAGTRSSNEPEDDVIVLDNNEIPPHLTKPNSSAKRVVTAFEPVKGTTTAQSSEDDDDDDDEQNSGSGSDSSGKPLEDIDNFWK